MDEPSAVPLTPQVGDRLSPPEVPRWVKVFGVIAAVVVLLVLVLLLTGGNHGPGRHSNGGENRSPGVGHSVQHP